MMGKQNKPNKPDLGDRQNREQGEGYATTPTGLPEERFSGSKQVLSPDQLGGHESPVAGTAGPEVGGAAAAATAIKSKIKVRPDASVELLEGKQVGGVPLETAGVTRSVAGVSSISVADDMSKTPYSKGDYRPGTRYGKKRSEDLFEMDNTITEQVAPGFDDSLDLRESPDSKQGFNGRKQFTQARAKKNVAGLPQNLLQDASADFIFTDQVIATAGQMLDGIEAKANYPIMDGDGNSIVAPMEKSNYELESLRIVVQNGHIQSVNFLEKRFKVHADPITRDQANMNWQVDANNVAKAMIRMQTELGRETAEKWSPLGYVIQSPYEYNMLMHDIEASTGAMMAIAYRAAVSSIDFQRNILSKDGIGPQASAIKMFVEDYAGELASSSFVPAGAFDKYIFNVKEYRKGSAAAIIRMFDSTTKYRTKADILGMQRSLTLHLSQCDNNINPLHVHPNFLKVLNKAHMFSTIDGTYNPRLPIYATRKIKVINPLSLQFFLADWKNPANFTADDLADPLRDNTTGTKSKYWYKYRDQRNEYKTRVQHPFVEGLLMWLLKHEGALVSTYGGEGAAAVTITIPCHFDFTNPGMFEFMICSASQEVAWQRNITFRDVLFAGDQMKYIWDDLASLHDLDPLHSTQLTIPGYNEALKLGKLETDVALRLLWNDSMVFLGHSTSGSGGDKYEYILPWYFNERAISKNSNLYTANEGFFDEATAFNMTMPSIRDGVRHEYVDLIKSVSERDLRLAMDRMITLPVFLASNPDYTATAGIITIDPITTAAILNNNIKVAALRYENNSDGRVIAQYDLTNGSNRYLVEDCLYCVPKELGWIWPGHSEDVKVITALVYNDADGHKEIDFTYASSAVGEVYDGSRCDRICSYRVKEDAITSGSVSRSAALTQIFYQCFALRDVAEVNNNYVTKTGLAPAISYASGAAETIGCVYNIDSAIAATGVSVVTSLKTASRVMWTKLQRVFYPINPFENAFIDSNSGAVNGIQYDPMDTAFCFGVCGTLASDFTQDILERLDVRDQLGIDYTEDIFAKDSLILR